VVIGIEYEIQSMTGTVEIGTEKRISMTKTEYLFYIIKIVYDERTALDLGCSTGV
jgi:hypothetical protein